MELLLKAAFSVVKAVAKVAYTTVINAAGKWLGKKLNKVFGFA